MRAQVAELERDIDLVKSQRASDLTRSVNPYFLETKIFCRPGNLNFALLRASLAYGTLSVETLTDMSTCPMATLADLQRPLPKAPLIPYWSLSAPAQDSILLILTTCHGWTLILMWKPSLPTLVCMYLLQAILEASRASEVICSFSKQTK